MSISNSHQPPFLKLYRRPILALILGAFLTVLVFFQVRSLEEQSLQQKIELYAQIRNAVFQKDFLALQKDLNFVRDLLLNEYLVEGNDGIKRKEFRFLTQVLMEMPGILSLNWVPQMGHEETLALSEAFQTLSDPPTQANLPDIPHHYPIYFSAFKGDTSLFKEGLDLGTSVLFREHLQQARDTGKSRLHHWKAAISKVLIFTPVYTSRVLPETLEARQKNILGFIVGEWNMDALITNSLLSLPINGIDFTISDENHTPPMQLYHHASRSRSQAEMQVRTGIVWKSSLQFFEHQWAIRTEAAPQFIRKHRSYYSWQALVLGLFLTLSAVLIHFLLGRKSDAIEALVESRTQALQKTSNQLKEAQDIARLGNWSLNLSNNHLYWSDQIFTLFEVDPDKVPASYEGFLNAIHPEDRDFVNQSYTDSLSNKKAYNIVHRLLMQDGRIKWVREMCHTEYDENGVASASHGIIQDITESWETRLQLNESEQRFRQMVEQSPFSLQLCSPEGKTLSVNPAWEALWELSFEALQNYNLLQDTELESKGIKSHIKQGFSGKTVEMPMFQYIPHKSRKMQGKHQGKWIKAFMYPIKDEDGKLIQVVLMHQDVTESRNHYERMQQLSSVVEQANDSIVITDPQGLIQYVNPAFEKISGYSREEAQGQTMRLVKSGMNPDEKYKELWGNILSGKPWRGSCVNLNKQGNHYTIDQIIVPILNEQQEQTYIVGIQRDVTQERVEQAHRQRVQNMETLGTLAAGVAHDFNNLLTVILGSTSLVERVLGTEHPMTCHLARASESAKTAGSLCNQMLAYSGQGSYLVEAFSLAQILKEMQPLLQATLPPQVELLLDLIDSECVMNADVSQIKQIVFALLLNASESIEEAQRSGIIKIATYKRFMEPSDFSDYIQDGAMKSSNYNCLDIEDTGCGMSERTLKKAFDPFFTTKFVGRGMGLSAVHGIVRSHNGAIQVHSTLGKGTCVKLCFPCDCETTPSGLRPATPP